MAVRYFVEDTSNLLKSATDYDAEPTPTGFTVVLKSVIEAVYDGDILLFGTWDGTDYTPPADYVAPYDSTTDAGMVKDAAHDMLDVFEGALALIANNPTAWSDDIRTKAVEGIHWQIVNSARVALNATRTHARRQKFCEESASWPDGVRMVILGSMWMRLGSRQLPVSLPTKDWSWVMPEPDPYTRVATWAMRHARVQ